MNDYLEKIYDSTLKFVHTMASPEDTIKYFNTLQQKISTTALYSVSTDQSFFETANKAFVELVRYAVVVPFSRERNEVEYEAYLKTIQYILYLFPIHKRHVFPKLVLECLRENILYKYQNIITIPSFFEPKPKFKCETEYNSITLFFDMIDTYMLSQMRFDDTFISDLFSFLNNPELSPSHAFYIFRILSHYIPKLQNDGFVLLRIFFFFMKVHYPKCIQMWPICDKYASIILNRCMRVMHDSIKALIERDFIPFIPKFRKLGNNSPLFLESFFKYLLDLLTIDKSNHTLVVDVIVRTFRKYHEIKSYREIWKLLLKFNSQYSYYLKCIQDSNDSINSPELIPSLVDIDPLYTPNFAKIKNIPPNLFFQIVSKQTKLLPIQRAHVRNFLNNTPPIELINKIFKLAPDEVLNALPNYPADYAVNLFNENKQLLKEKLDLAISIAEKTLSLPLLSMVVVSLVENGQEVRDDIIEELKSNLTDFEAYSDPFYIQAITHIFGIQNLTIDITKLLEQNPQGFLNLFDQDINSCKLFERLMDIIQNSNIETAAKAYRILLNSQNLKQIFEYFPYETSGKIYEVTISSEYLFEALFYVRYPVFIPTKQNIFQKAYKDIFPYVIASGNKEFLKRFLIDSKLSMNYLIQKCAGHIFEYTFVCADNKIEAIQNIQIYINSLASLLSNNQTKFAARVLPACVHPVIEKAEAAANAIQYNICLKLNPNHTQEEEQKKLIDFWTKYSPIPILKAIKKQKWAIPLIEYSLQYIMCDIDKFISDIFTEMSIAISIDSLQLDVLHFWKMFFLRDDLPIHIVKNLFVRVVQHAILLFNAYPKESSQVLKILIVDYKDITSEYFKEIAYYPYLSDSSQLADVKHVIKQHINVIEWNEQVIKLSKQLELSNLDFRRILLQTIKLLLKEHENELYEGKVNIEKLTSIIWSSAVHEVDPTNIILFGSIMSLLPFSSGSLFNKDSSSLIDINDVDSILIHFISEYLSKIIGEFANTKYVIQEFLRMLGCRIDSDSDNKDVIDPEKEKEEFERGERNWNRFKNDTKLIIGNYRSTIYIVHMKPPTFDSKPIISNYLSNNDFTSLKWMGRFFLKLLTFVPSCTSDDTDKKKKDGGFLEYLKVISNVSSALMSTAISYLIAYNKDNVQFCDCIREEWHAIYQLLDDNDRKIQDIGRTVMRCFFSIFEPLNMMKISESQNKILKEWSYLNIANEYELARAALRTQLWTKAVYHLDIVMRYKSESITPEKEREILKMMTNAFKYAGDSDSYKYLQNKLEDDNDVGDKLGISEMNLMDESINRNKKINIITNMVEFGRYERALNDSKNLRTGMQSNLRLDSAITKSALALGRWDEIESLFNTTNNQLSYVFDDSSNCIEAPSMRFDIAVGKYLANLQNYSTIDYSQRIQEQRIKLVPELLDSFLSSYETLLPMLVQIRIWDELETFSKNYYDNKQFDLKPMKRWLDQEPLTIEQLSKVTCIRCGIINAIFGKKIDVQHKKEFMQAGEIFSSENTPEKGRNHFLCHEWLNLSRSCRKNDLIFAADIHSARAKKLAPAVDEMQCVIELAKVLWAKNPSDSSVKVLDYASKTPEMKAKASYLRAKFLDNLNSLDANGIANFYLQATEAAEQAGKAHYMLATLTDQRIDNYINYVEAEGQEVAVSGKLSRFASQKFWGTTSSSMTIAQFLKQQIPLALKNYFESIIKAPQYSTEVVPRILALFFDNCRILLSQNPPRPYSLISATQKPNILKSIQDTMKQYIPKINPSIWYNSFTQLISRVEQSEELAPYLFELIEKAVSFHPESILWHLMYVNHSHVELRQYKFERIWDKIIEANEDKAAQFEEWKTKFSSITTNLIAMTTQIYKTKSPTDVSANDLCPNLANSFLNSNIKVPITKAFKSNQVDNAPTIMSLDDKIHIFLSQQMPRQITVHTNEGQNIRFLCKKDDDLRKDMRMMEFASFVNTLLERDHRCRQRNMSMTVYAVVCLDERCAMIEWAEHTKCFRAIVTKLYESHNMGMTMQEINEQIGAEMRISPQRKYQNFVQNILPNFPPITHLWFASRFKDTAKWFNAQSTYTRSTAVWSMVGYIVGLGDRHAENILFNKETGAAVHVDFCCMFDRAKSLDVPECVPFRLTQNIVDGMGALGVDAAFTSSCCLVMSTLREKANKIVTMLQTFVQDPLLEWKKMSKDCEEIAAQQTLKEIERRLRGYSEDRSKIHSTEYFVKDLIDQATDNRNLAKMWYGWQPYF